MPTQTPQDQYVQVGQINTRFWAQGEVGSNVVLIHGIGGYMEHWIHNIQPLAEHHRVYALDLVGNGRTDKPEADYTMAYFAQFVHDFLETQHIERATLVGNSMGGAVTLQFALQFPDQVDKLVLVNSAGLGKELTIFFRLPTLPLIGEWLTRPSRKGAAQLLEEAFYDSALVTDALIDLDYEMAAQPGAQKVLLTTLRRSVSLLGIREDVLHPAFENLTGILAPTLIVWGEQDAILPVAHAYAGEKQIPNARLHIFDRCGHMPQLECPEEFNELVLEFLAD
jgi:4,5:9,10-diseco-3-hydroxy-5,9,17-trioxoandrosta-1(10),2-diene-4-oate hydrolase